MQKKILITGATSGIGFETAILFAEKGYRIIALGRKIDGLKKLQELIGKEHVFIKFDLTNIKKIYSLIKNIEKEIGELDVFINNAGIGLFKKLESINDNEINDLLSINLLAPIILCREIIPLMKERGGTIVNISSVAGKRTWKNLTIYSASKFGLIGFSNSLRREFKFYNYPIRVMVVCPPAIDTKFFENAGYKNYKEDHPAQRLLSSRYVAEEIYKGVIKNKREVIIGRRAKILDKATSLFPVFIENLEDFLKKKR